MGPPQSHLLNISVGMRQAKVLTLRRRPRPTPPPHRQSLPRNRAQRQDGSAGSFPNDSLLQEDCSCCITASCGANCICSREMSLIVRSRALVLSVPARQFDVGSFCARILLYFGRRVELLVQLSGSCGLTLSIPSTVMVLNIF